MATNETWIPEEELRAVVAEPQFLHLDISRARHSRPLSVRTQRGQGRGDGGREIDARAVQELINSGHITLAERPVSEGTWAARHDPEAFLTKYRLTRKPE